MRLLAIDPGTEMSAWVLYDTDTRIPLEFGKAHNHTVRDSLAHPIVEFDAVVIEMVASYGKPVGQEVFETCVWIGRFLEASPRLARRIMRKDVKMHLCGSVSKVTDAVIRQRIIDLYGGNAAAIGRKASPGTLYGIAADVWQALALAITFAERETSGHKVEVL
jgi:hypothetical protein